MGQALYRKYRSKRLAEIVGQEHITTTLEHALKSGQISHAYLFTGPRGTGKTSIARILAHEINNLPYTDDSSHMDIIEIDAASNRRIDEIRELRDKVYVAPTSATYKVYIIDEVHMLTKEAFNALLKTLEEPPAHVVFMLATTDAHKLPDTIISRTQRFSFKPVEQAKVIAHLRTIASAEKIDITDEALALLAAHGEGSFRDSISLLDQASSSDTRVTLNAVQRLLGIPPDEAVNELITLLATNAPANQLMTALSNLYDSGYQAAAIATQLAARLRNGIAQGNGKVAANTSLQLLKLLLEVPTAHHPELFLELSLLQLIITPVTIAPMTSPEPALLPALPEPEPAKPKKHAPAESSVEHTVEPSVKVKHSANAVVDDDSWSHILNELKKQYNTLYGVVRMATPTFEGNRLTLEFGFAFHQKRINEAKNRQIILDTIEHVTGKQVELICLISENRADTAPKLAPSPKPTPNNALTEDSLSTISNIFGGGELLE